MYMKVLEEWMEHSRYSKNINIFLLSLLRSPRRKKQKKQKNNLLSKHRLCNACNGFDYK